MSADDAVTLRTEEGVATLRLNRPEERNALGPAVVAALDECVTALEVRDDLRLVVLRGNGNGFCAGADTGLLARSTPTDLAAASLRCAEVCQRLAKLPVATVAVWHGYAVGGGFLLGLYCDLRYGVRGAKLGFPPATRQWLPPWGLARLAQWVGPLRAQQLLLTGGVFSVEQAGNWGLVERVVSQDGIEAALTALADGQRQANLRVAREVRQFFGDYDGTGPDAAWNARSAAAFERLVGGQAARQAIARLQPGDAASFETRQSP